ncbi:TPA: DUF4396 domain-containing protein [Legionella pneumophila]|nr:DUF4396 domain-containing protein [Legionella pneumophila]MDW8879735.1 DUF4396 domain-containing protein [Legionella pneumophila subsp. fraseri]MDW8962775.1 DUF4396 domain-containing protein [Legionella pneumophila subsp. fraseri]MDW9035875.1 DUF4396 domain-containing protein [Legionella pneumophila subsp. fraseri]MDW9039376.1 DUF4396 domain-containing protein [Legionella pneumophila subsp. fraseri]MDW9042224.1 DUF4396 domain-containing protein [Legionella pneumophila subsp. fraseri]
MIDGIMVLWFILLMLSLAFIAYDVREMPIDWVQKLGWVLVVAYTGPFGLFFYFLTCRSPGKGLHALYTKAQWKQAVNSEVHCLAGDATGIIFAAIFLSFIDLSNGVELILEYISAFIFGWVIFQAGMMRSMYSGYGEALRKTFFAETVSMNFVMMGMIPVMMILMNTLEYGRNPAHLQFWFIMGMATIVGGFIAFPINNWLVKKKLKHGCMTLPEEGEHSEGHMPHHHGGHEEHLQAQAKRIGSKVVHGHTHEMGSLPLNIQLKYIGISFGILLIIILIMAFFVPLKI